MATVAHESSFIPITVAILALTSTFALVISPVALVPPTCIVATTEDDLAAAMLEAILEDACIDIAAESSQSPYPLHFAFNKHALVDITILELETTFTVEVRSDG